MNPETLLHLTAQIVSAVGPAVVEHCHDTSVSGLIYSVHAALSDLDQDKQPALAELIPAVPVKKSIQPDYLVCLEDGKKLKILKRYLKTAFNMTPEQYRERWNLPADYPMVAPNYAARRSELAKEAGLGWK